MRQIDPSEMFQSFYRILTKVVDKHIPRGEMKSDSMPWITNAIKSTRVKSALYANVEDTLKQNVHSIITNINTIETNLTI